MPLPTPAQRERCLAEAAASLAEAIPDPEWTESSFAFLGRFAAQEKGAGKRWILKIVADDETSERRYYADHPFPEFPTVPCRASGSGEGVYWLLLEDLTATHEPSFGRPKTPAYARLLGESIARLHRRAALLPPASLEIYIGRLAPGFPKMGADIERRFVLALDETMATEGDRFIEIHGDLNPGNLLVRRDADADLRLIDRQPLDYSLRVWTPEADLATAILPWWSPEERAAGESVAITAFAEVSGRDEAAVRRSYDLARWLAVGIVAEWRSESEQEAAMEWVWRDQWARIAPALGLPE